MKPARPHLEEQLRIETLESYEILDSESDHQFQLIVEQLGNALGVPIAAICLVDQERQWIFARIGIDITETPRDISFCAHVVFANDLFVVPDARKDERFYDNPFVTGPAHVVFYAGVPLRAKNGLPLGTLCVVDCEPRELSDPEQSIIWSLARQVEQLLEERQRNRSSAKKLLCLANVEASRPWDIFSTTVAATLTEFAQRELAPIDAPKILIDLDDVPVATIRHVDPEREVALSLDVAIDRAFLSSFARDLFGESADKEQENAVLLECANILMGAVKITFEAEENVLYAGFPHERIAGEAALEFSRKAFSQRHVFVIDRNKIEVRLSIETQERQTVSGADARAGMVVLRDVRGINRDTVLACAGSRLTEPSAQLIAESVPDKDILVAIVA